MEDRHYYRCGSICIKFVHASLFAYNRDAINICTALTTKYDKIHLNIIGKMRWISG